jgi:hypothetical protein
VPALQLVVEFEGAPVLRVVADALEDELRLLAWVTHPATRSRLRDAIEAAFEEIAERAV